MDFVFTNHSLERLRKRFPGKKNDEEMETEIVNLLKEPLYKECIETDTYSYQITTDFYIIIKEKDDCYLVITGYSTNNKN